MTIKEYVDGLQDKTIRKINPSLNYLEREKIKEINNKITTFIFIILQGMSFGIIFLKIIPQKYGWPYAQTCVLLTILMLQMTSSLRLKLGVSKG